MVHGIQVWTEGQEITHGVVPFEVTDVIHLKRPKKGVYTFPIKSAQGTPYITLGAGSTVTKVIDGGNSGTLSFNTIFLEIKGHTGYIYIDGKTPEAGTPLQFYISVYRRR